VKGLAAALWQQMRDSMPDIAANLRITTDRATREFLARLLLKVQNPLEISNAV